MIGIYQDNFIEYLKEKLGDRIKTTSNNIICPCPFCEYGKEKDHYHMYLSLELPIFHCFHASCEESGSLKKLLTQLEGHDISSNFVDKEQLKKIKKQKLIFNDKVSIKKIDTKLPILNPKQFPEKDLYIKKRLKFADIGTKRIKGLIYDVRSFINLNNIEMDVSLQRIVDYLQTNFVGFLTENKSMVIFRNIDHSQHMSFYKLKIHETNFLDYYRLNGGNLKSNKIVLAEGVFDIFTEQLFDSINIKDQVRFYASALSSKYIALIKSIIFYEQIFQPEVVILSDRGISIDYYKKLKKYNKHIIKSLTVFYNENGKDFNCTPVKPFKVVI